MCLSVYMCVPMFYVIKKTGFTKYSTLIPKDRAPFEGFPPKAKKRRGFCFRISDASNIVVAYALHSFLVTGSACE